MPELHELLDESISIVDRLAKILRKCSSPQVRSADECALAKATAFAWFKSVRPSLGLLEKNDLLLQVDEYFKIILDFSARATTRLRYKELLRSLRKCLVKLRSAALLLDARGELCPDNGSPHLDLSPLVADAKMQGILLRRWAETENCIKASAPLAAIVMMGALLEALFLARLNTLPDKRPVFRLKCTPLDKTTGKARPLTDWTLKHYIDAAHEMRWIRQSARDVGIVLRDYRNYIHPEKELSHGVDIDIEDAKVFWPIFRSLAEQIVGSI